MSDQYHPDFTTWGAVSKTIHVLKTEIAFFGALIILYAIISTLPALYIYDGIDFSDPAAIIKIYSVENPLFLVTTIFYYLLFALYFVFAIDRTDAHLNGYSFDDYPYLSRGLKSVLPVIIIYIISMLLMMVGLFLFIVPGLIVMAGLYLAIPAKLAENISIFEAISRSWDLSKGHRMAIWGVILIPLIPIIIIVFTGMSFMIGDLQESGDISALMSPAYIILNAAINGIVTTFYIVATAVCYHQIKMEKIA